MRKYLYVDFNHSQVYARFMCPKWDSFSYADPGQEAKRLAALDKVRTEKAERDKDAPRSDIVTKKRNTAWSHQAERKADRERRRDKKKLKKKWLASQAASDETPKEQIIGKRHREEPDEMADAGTDIDDWRELAREEKMAKRVRKGLVSQKEFDDEFADLGQ